MIGTIIVTLIGIAVGLLIGAAVACWEGLWLWLILDLVCRANHWPAVNWVTCVILALAIGTFSGPKGEPDMTAWKPWLTITLSPIFAYVVTWLILK